MAKKFLIASGKGGVGKSTVAVHLARALAKRGKKVLLFDADIALSALDILLNVGEKIIYNWYDEITERCKPGEAAVLAEENLLLLPAPLYAIGEFSSGKINELLQRYDPDCDYIIIDAPAGIGAAVMSLATCAENALVIATPDEVSVRGAFTVADLLEKNGVTQARLIINRFRRKAVKQGNQLDLDNVIDKTGVRLIGILPEDIRLVFASVTHEPIPKKSLTAKAFARVAARIDGERILLGKI